MARRIDFGDMVLDIVKIAVIIIVGIFVIGLLWRTFF